MEHIPVLLKETMDFLKLKKEDVVLDATIDGGGHGAAICGQIGAGGRLIGIDQDDNMLEIAKTKMQKLKCKIDFLGGNFRNLDRLVSSLGIEKVDAVLFDFGMSSLQLENSDRGFSFQRKEPLLMNYKSELSSGDITAKEILNSWPEKDIAGILRDYGEERYAYKIARRIVERRKNKRFETTDDLLETLRSAVPIFYTRGKIHFATKTFQALRIAVNDELRAISEGLGRAWDVLDDGGRMVAISFHSLEDRIVKNFFREKKKQKEGIVLTKKPLVASREEMRENPRSRSAKLRAVVKSSRAVN